MSDRGSWRPLPSRRVALVRLELYEGHQWSDEPEQERPTEDDAVSAAVDLIRQARRAGSNRKREVLFHAFYMRFNPEFYKDGMGKMLWQIACDLEYPTTWALRQIVDLEKEAEEARERMRRDGMGREPFGRHVKYDSDVWPHLSRLETQGLIVQGPTKSKNVSVFVSSLGRAFIRFALDAYRERGDTPDPVKPG